MNFKYEFLLWNNPWIYDEAQKLNKYKKFALYV